MMEHTKGPWVYRSGSVYTIDGICIANMDRAEPRTSPTERDANARLIAKAPELLEQRERLLYSRLDSAIFDLRSWMEDNRDDFATDANRQLSELTDLAVPCYASDVMALAADIPADCFTDGARDKVLQIVEDAARNYYSQKLQRAYDLACAAYAEEMIDHDELEAFALEYNRERGKQ